MTCDRLECWHAWVEAEVQARGLRISSGYRPVARERELGGPATSWHCHGDAEHPGAYDVVGSDLALATFYSAIRNRFRGRIRELFLNLGDEWRAIKDNVRLEHNPEVGRAKHLHVAIAPQPGTR